MIEIGNELTLLYSIELERLTRMARRSVAQATFVVTSPCTTEKGWWLAKWIPLSGDADNFISLNYMLSQLGK
jgi:hypothetical protein